MFVRLLDLTLSVMRKISQCVQKSVHWRVTNVCCETLQQAAGFPIQRKQQQGTPQETGIKTVIAHFENTDEVQP
jgi:hypothetical protein